MGVLNPTPVDLNLLFTYVQLPLSVVMALLFILGLSIGAVIISIQVIRLRWLVRQKTKHNQKLSDQIIQLKKANIEAKESLRKDSNILVNIEN